MNFSITTTKKNILSNITLQLITAISGFILPPLLITHYNSSTNGLISSIKQFIAYLSLVEAGVGISSIAALYEPIAINDMEKRNSILSATRKFYNLSGYFFLGLLIICSFGYSFLVRKEYSFATPFILFIILGTSTLSDFFLIGKYRVLLFATKRNYVISLVQTFSVILNTLLCVILIKHEINIIIVQAVSYSIFIIRYIILRFYVKNVFINLNYHAVPDKNALAQRWDALFLQLSSLAIFNSPVLILTIFCSLSDVSVYTIFAMIFTAVDSLVSVFSNGLSANFGELYYKDGKKLISYFRKYETLFFLFIGWCYSCTFLLAKDFLSIYTRGFTDTNYNHFEYIPLFVFIGIMNKVRVPGGMLIEAAGKFSETRNRGIIEAAINIIASILFTYKCGAIGVLYGACCSYLYRTIDVIIYTNKKILNSNYINSIIKIFAACSVFTLIVFILLQIKQKFHFLYNIDSYILWLFEAIFLGCILGLPLITYLLGKKICKK